MKGLVKSLIPPLLLGRLNYARSYRKFLRYKDIVRKNVDLKDIHRGKRCFLLGSGPSIKKEDLGPLKNEIVFALNNFYVHENFQEIMKGDVPKYYMTAPIHRPQTDLEWRDWFFDMQKKVPLSVNMIMGLDVYDKNTKYIFERYQLFEDFNIYWYFAGLRKEGQLGKFQKSDVDLSRMILTANTVSIYALINAIYMGFDEIYLLGMDHNYFCFNSEDNYRFYKNAIHQNNEDARTKEINGTGGKAHELLAAGEIFLQYETLQNNCNNKIYNLSKDSLCDVFEFRDLKEILR